MSAYRMRSGKDKRRRKRAVIGRDGECCWFCGATEELTLDHILPLSQGGSNRIENLQLLCRPCNSAKADADWPRKVAA